MNILSWLPFSVAVVGVVTAIALGYISFSRDFFFLLVYVQSLIYVDVAPTLALSSVPFAAANLYSYFQWTALALFQLPFLGIYAGLKRNTGHRASDDELSVPRAALLFGGCLSLAIAYYVVGTRNGLLNRRAQDATALQLDLGIVEFALLRLFHELGLFLVALQFLVLRRCARRQRYPWMTAAFLVTSVAYLAYALTNSRMMSLLFLGMLCGVYLSTVRGPSRFRAGYLLGGLVTILCALYAMRVAQNVRQSVGVGESLFAASNFLPIGIDRGIDIDPLSSRLNGLDLIVKISENVNNSGPAWGRAWALPFFISLDPIVRTDFTIQAKSVSLTSTKSFLLLMYAGIGASDYYSCILSDAYGNLGLLGFLASAFVLAGLLAWSSTVLARAATPLLVVLALFVVVRVLPFEQEFGTVLFGWFKTVPVAILVGFLYPLRPLLPPPSVHNRF